MDSKIIIIDDSMYFQFHALFIFRSNVETVQLQFFFLNASDFAYIVVLSFALFTVPVYFVFIYRVC